MSFNQSYKQAKFNKNRQFHKKGNHSQIPNIFHPTSNKFPNLCINQIANQKYALEMDTFGKKIVYMHLSKAIKYRKVFLKLQNDKYQ